MSNKALVITGASRGIGYAAAELFMANAYRVINLSRRQPALSGLIHISADLKEQNWVEAVRPQLEVQPGLGVEQEQHGENHGGTL